METESTAEVISLWGQNFPIDTNYEGLVTVEELKRYLPSMGDDLYSQLKADIEANGINDPILYFETPEGFKLVVEGHTRLRAAIELGLKEDTIPSREVKESFESMNDIKLWMLRHQIQRRNLSAPEKLRFAMEHRSTIEAKARENMIKGGKGKKVETKINTAVEIAKMAGVSKETAKRYMKVYEKNDSSILDQLDQGKITIYKASRKSKEERKKPDIKSVPSIVESYEEGVEKLKNNDYAALIVLKNQDAIKNFLPVLYSKYLFHILKD